MLQYLVCVDSHVPGDSHFSIFFNWQGLMVIPFVSTLYPIFPTHLPVYPQGHLVVALPILILHPLIMCHSVSVDSPRNLHSDVSEILPTLCLIEFVLKACSCPTIITHSWIPINPLLPSFLGRYNLATLLLVYRRPFIAKIVLAVLSMLAISSMVQFTTPAL